MNGIDFRFLVHIKRLLERNARIREKARPLRYRQRIEQLLECQREVGLLGLVIGRNQTKKRSTRVEHAEVMQELRSAQQEEAEKQSRLQELLDDVRSERMQLDEEIVDVRAKVRTIRAEGDYEATQLQARIDTMEERMHHHGKLISSSRKQVEEFDIKAAQEISGLKEELEASEKARTSAQLLAAAAQQNLDSFVASLKSIEQDIAGGAEPRRRMVDQVPRAEARSTSRQRPRTPNRTSAQRPRTPNRTAPATALPVAALPRPPRPRSGTRRARPRPASPSPG